MKDMSLQPQPKPNSKRTGKRITFFNDQGVAMKEASQHTEPYYGIGVPPSVPGHNDSGGVESLNAEAPHTYLNSVIFSPEKSDQSRGHYQQMMPMKWSHQDLPLHPQQRQNNWSQGMAAWSQNFDPYLGAQAAFAKQMHEAMSVQQQQPEPLTIRATEKQVTNISGETFRDTTKPGRGMDWEQQQGFQQTQKPVMLNPQQHGQSNPGNSVLQPFQIAFGQPKQNLVAGYYQAVQGNRTLPNLNYSTQANSQLLQQLQQQEHQQLQQQEQQQLQQQEQQQKLQRQMFQQRQQQIRQQVQQQQVLQRQKQPQQISQLQQQAQQLKHTTQQPQQHMEQIQPQQDLMQQQQKSKQPLQNQHVLENYSDGQKPHAASLDQHQPSSPGQSQETTDPLSTQTQDSIPQPPSTVPQQSIETQQPGPRRSRRLSKEGGSPGSDNPFVMPTDLHTQGSQNGASEISDIRAAPTGVIQSTRRKRRVSQEVNLETLAQKASERESLPSRSVKVRQLTVFQSNMLEKLKYIVVLQIHCYDEKLVCDIRMTNYL